MLLRGYGFARSNGGTETRIVRQDCLGFLFVSGKNGFQNSHIVYAWLVSVEIGVRVEGGHVGPPLRY